MKPLSTNSEWQNEEKGKVALVELQCARKKSLSRKPQRGQEERRRRSCHWLVSNCSQRHSVEQRSRMAGG
ncbi:uncharacterized protein K444DRAFT_217689 [Hyaloscypha bicolor E]|uniref:Uncharacterized protein n=1 Tax=Hyaloscypha bicolor E TaxID=1095630 RepID=A0A2J6SP01_9HELO|nr:uncharacterized protein K444DRAFT_217689 [Hyaloscypha bicolor E]PMD52501.1 hypothetical protein K444DRAFT_217689 [Hyaloscypha bicolor E]